MAHKSGTSVDLHNMMTENSTAASVVRMWEQYHEQRSEWEEEAKERRDFVFATDTSHTSQGLSTPWKNKTTIPKVAQIRDNLHANYMTALFANDRFFEFEAYEPMQPDKNKADIINALMSNKVRESRFKRVCSQLLYDYIDYGNAFADIILIDEKHELSDGEVIPGYVGPAALRVSPLDIVFDPRATDFQSTPKVRRALYKYADFLEWVEQTGEQWVQDAIEKTQYVRNSGHNQKEDWAKIEGLAVDGFGSYHAYLQSGTIELLEITGNIYDAETETLYRNHVITVVDRAFVARLAPLPDWFGKGYLNHVRWRERPDNLWGMGPLDNLIGMQYRIDHLENAKADLVDLEAGPPIHIIGQVDEFEFGPGEVIQGDIGSEIKLLKMDPQVAMLDNQLAQYMALMEEFAGAPKQAMGIRTPGEKTAFEVAELQNAASRIFQAKLEQFEQDIVEPLLNAMLELYRRTMKSEDVVRIWDDEQAMTKFLAITPEDITAKGKIRAVGSRHFAQKAQLVQNLTQLSNTVVYNDIRPHVRTDKLAQTLNEALDLERYGIIEKHAGIYEQADLAATQQAVQQSVAANQQGAMELNAPVQSTAGVGEAPIDNGSSLPEGIPV